MTIAESDSQQLVSPDQNIAHRATLVASADLATKPASPQVLHEADFLHEADWLHLVGPTVTIDLGTLTNSERAATGAEYVLRLGRSLARPRPRPPNNALAHQENATKGSQMSDRDQLAELISSLKQQRDELVLQIHLGKEEAKEELEALTTKLDELTQEFDPLKEAVGESAANVFDAMKLVAGEIGEGFQRIRKTL